jgi:hypothetical protein
MKQAFGYRKSIGEIKKKQEGNVHVKVTLRNLNLTIVDVVKQYVLRILTVCL